MGMLAQAKALTERPHVVVATPGRIRVLMEDPDIAAVFSKTKVWFLIPKLKFFFGGNVLSIIR